MFPGGLPFWEMHSPNGNHSRAASPLLSSSSGPASLWKQTDRHPKRGRGRESTFLSRCTRVPLSPCSFPLPLPLLCTVLLFVLLLLLRVWLLFLLWVFPPGRAVLIRLLFAALFRAQPVRVYPQQERKKNVQATGAKEDW